MNQTYSDFREHYRRMHTQKLLELSASTDLVPEARLALDAELGERKDEIEATPPPAVSGRSHNLKRKAVERYFGWIVVLAIALAPAALPFIRDLINWLRN